jgi:hypothetical protein
MVGAALTTGVPPTGADAVLITDGPPSAAAMVDAVTLERKVPEDLAAAGAAATSHRAVAAAFAVVEAADSTAVAVVGSMAVGDHTPEVVDTVEATAKTRRS